MTDLFLTAAPADSAVTAGSGTKWKAGTVPGTVSTHLNKNTVTGPTAPLQMTDGATAGTDGTVVSWYTDPLAAVTIAGAITLTLWDRENATANNVAPTVRIERCSANGTVQSTIVSETVNHGAAEMGVTAGGATDTISVTAANVTDTAIAAGERLRITLWIDDAADQTGTGSMATGGRGEFWVNGPVGSAGQARVSFTETVIPTPAVGEINFVDQYGLQAGTTSLTMTPPSGTTAGDLAVIYALTKLSGVTPTISGGGTWTQVDSQVVGTGADGAGTGPMRLTVWQQELTAAAGTPTVTISGGNAALGGGMVYRKNPADAWVTPSAKFGSDTVSDTAFSAAMSATDDYTPGDWLVAVGGTTANTTLSARNITLPGCTVYYAGVNSGGTANGNDMFLWTDHEAVLSGSQSSAATTTGTTAVATTGGSVQIKISVSPAGTLLAAYNFDEGSGNVLDATGNGNDFAVPTGTARTTGSGGHTNEGIAPTTTVSVQGPASLIGQTPMRTLMMWVKNTADFTGWIWEHHDNTLDTGTWGLLCLSGNLGFRGRNAGGTTAHAAVARPTDNAWHHWAGTYDGVNVRTYLDGTLVATTALTGPIDTAIPDVQRLFTTVGAVVTVDDLRVYSSALTASEISSLKDTPVGSSGSTLTLDGSLAPVTGTADVTASDDATLSGSLAPVTGALAVDAAAATSLAGTLASITGSLAADAVATLAADGQLTPATGSLVADASASSSLTGSLASVVGAFVIDAAGTASGALDGTLQSVTAALAVTASDDATLAGNLAPVTAAVNVTAQIDGTMAASLSPATAQLVVDALTTAALAGTLQSLTGSFAADTIEGSFLNGTLAPVTGSFSGDVGADATFSAQLSAAVGAAIVQASDDLTIAGQLSAITLTMTVQVVGVPRDIIAVVTANLEQNAVVVQGTTELATVTEGTYQNYAITEGDMRPKWRVGTIEFVDFSVNVKDADGGGLTQADVEGYGWKIAVTPGASTPSLADFVVPSVTPVIEPDTEGGFDVAIKHLYTAAEKGLHSVFVHFGPTPEEPILPAASFVVL